MSQKLVSIIIPTHNRIKQLKACLNSLEKIDYKNTETIIIDDASTDGTSKIIKDKFPKIKIISLKKNKGVAAARNLGIEKAKGDYLLFVDDDNLVKKDFLNKLINLAETDSKIGFVGPKMYYAKDKKRIWFAGVKINLLTSRTHFIGINEIDGGQFDKVREIDQIPNVWLVTRKVIDKVGGLDENYVIHYDESDWPMRAKKAGFTVLFCPKSIVYHDVPIIKGFRKVAPSQGVPRSYYYARNRIIFMRRFASKINFAIFLITFNNLFAIFYLFNDLRYKQYNSALWYLRGLLDGILNK